MEMHCVVYWGFYLVFYLVAFCHFVFASRGEWVGEDADFIDFLVVITMDGGRCMLNVIVLFVNVRMTKL